MESFQNAMDVNYFGCVRMTKAVVPYMKEKRGGRILQVSSVLGLKRECIFGHLVTAPTSLFVLQSSRISRKSEH